MGSQSLADKSISKCGQPEDSFPAIPPLVCGARAGVSEPRSRPKELEKSDFQPIPAFSVGEIQTFNQNVEETVGICENL